MWVSRAEMRRLLKDREHYRLRSESLEADLRLERERNREHEGRLIDQVLTAAGRYAVSESPRRPAARQAAEKPPESALEEARREAYRRAAVDAGLTEEDGERAYRERFSSPVPFEPEFA